MHIYLQIFGVIAVILTLLSAVDVALRLSADAHVRGLAWAPVMFAVIAGACFVGAHLLEGCSCT
jgi:hypothetical protein